MNKITTFRVMQMSDVPSTDCHTLEDFAISRFGTTELPSHVKVEIVDVQEGADSEPETPAAPAATETPAADGQADQPAA